MTDTPENLPPSLPSHPAPPAGGGGAAFDVAIWIEPLMLRRESAFVRHLVMGLKADDQRVSFIAPAGLDLSILPTLGSRLLTYRLSSWDRLGVLSRLRLAPVINELLAHPPDVLVVWGDADAGLVGIIAQATQIPIVVWAWDGAELFTQLLTIPQVRHVIASSHPIIERVPSAFRVPVTLIHPGVYCDELLACYDVDGQLPCLVSLDPLSDIAAYDALIRACRKLADEGTDFLLFAYDTGREEHPIWKLAEKLGLLDRLSFVPFQQDAEPLLLHGDLFIHVLASNRVNYATLDAMGRGLCIITCPNHGADYLIDGQTCRIVREPSPESWYYVLSDLIADRPKAVALARRGQQLVRDRHEMTRTLTQFTSACRQAAGTPLRLAPA